MICTNKNCFCHTSVLRSPDCCVSTFLGIGPGTCKLYMPQTKGSCDNKTCIFYREDNSADSDHSNCRKLTCVSVSNCPRYVLTQADLSCHNTKCEFYDEKHGYHDNCNSETRLSVSKCKDYVSSPIVVTEPPKIAKPNITNPLERMELE